MHPVALHLGRGPVLSAPVAHQQGEQLTLTKRLLCAGQGYGYFPLIYIC